MECYLLTITQWLQVLCTVVVVTGLCDLVKSVVDKIDDNSEVANYQIISPIVLLLSAVSVSVCLCDVSHCQIIIGTDDSSDNKGEESRHSILWNPVLFLGSTGHLC